MQCIVTLFRCICVDESKHIVVPHITLRHFVSCAWCCSCLRAHVFGHLIFFVFGSSNRRLESNNDLTGTIPKAISAMTNLDYL
jgi:hypothetical protein